MLRVFEQGKGKVGDFKGYEDLCEFIMKKPGLWSFNHHTYAHLKHLCSLKKPEYITLSETKALEKGLGLIEMRRGTKAPLRQIIVTFELDGDEVRKGWCLEYCAVHNYLIFETTWFRDVSILLEPSQQPFPLALIPYQNEEICHD